jgi:hypothetical protein
VEDEWSPLHYGHIRLKEIALATHWIESSVGPDFVARRKVSLLGNSVNHCINVCGALYKLHDFIFCLAEKREVFCLELRQ